MTEEQAEIIISILEEISENIKTIKRNTENIPKTSYDASDICSRLEDVVSAIQNQ